MSESAEIPNVEPIAEAEVKPAIPPTPERTSPEPTQARLAEVRQNISRAIPPREPPPPPIAPLATPTVEPPKYSLPEKFRNIVFNRYNQIGLAFAAETAVFMPPYVLAKAAFGGSMLVEAAIMPTLVALMFWTGQKILFKDVIPMGNFTSMFPVTSWWKKNTPVGNINLGEVYGEFHTGKNIGKMSDLSIRQRTIALAADGLDALAKLAIAIEQKNPRVANIKSYKATSHLIAQYPELFQRVGFVIENKKQTMLDNFEATTTKGIFSLVWGTRQLLAKRSLRGLREAFNLSTEKRATAWITPQALVEHKGQIIEELARFQKLAERDKR